MMKKYNYRSIKKISKDGICFMDDFFIQFDLCRLNWAKRNNILPNETHCVAVRDITAKYPYFMFYLDSEVIIYFKKNFFNNWHKNFQKLRFTIEEMGYSTYDLS